MGRWQWIMGGGIALLLLGGVSLLAFGGDPHVAEGKRLYVYYCGDCHGEKGRGDGYNALRLDPRPRDLTDAIEPYMVDMSNAEIFKAIREGVAGTFPDAVKAKAAAPAADKAAAEEDEEGGSPLMPYWGYTLTDRQIWSIVAFIRTLHDHDAEAIDFASLPAEAEDPTLVRPQPVSFPDAGSVETARLAELGRRLYDETYSCSGCHGVGGKQGAGGGGEIGPDLSRAGFRLNAPWIYQWIQYPQSFNHETKMPAFNMPEEHARAIAIYLKTLRAEPEPESAAAGAVSSAE